MVTENQEGEKLRTTRRQPTSYLDRGWKVGCGVLGLENESPAGLPVRLEGDTDVVQRDARDILRSTVDVREKIGVAGIVIAGLFDAKRINSSSSSAMTSVFEGSAQETMKRDTWVIADFILHNRGDCRLSHLWNPQVILQQSNRKMGHREGFVFEEKQNFEAKASSVHQLTGDSTP
jgi:hypothetical protein